MAMKEMVLEHMVMKRVVLENMVIQNMVPETDCLGKDGYEKKMAQGEENGRMKRWR